MKYCVVFLISFYILCVVSNPLIVELANGKVQGRDNGYYYSYESIPYAEPPIGDLRFEAPRPYQTQWNSTFDATQPPQLCLQWSIMIDKPNKLVGKEDCLTVSVYKPKNESRKSFPVLTIIHGGAFMFGGAVEIGHEYMLASGNMIVVKISYRLGPLGFLSAGDSDLPGNFGLKDQRLALEWIRKNIAYFNGEPENILLFGQSAGGASVHLQLLQKDIKQLVKGAISISGNALDPWVVQQAGSQKALKLAEIVNCIDMKSTSELKKCLKSKDAKDIVSAVQHFLVIGYVPSAVFSPVIETEDTNDYFLIQHPEDIIRNGYLAEVPWLTSYTTEDGGFNAAMFMEIQSNGKELIEELNNRWKDLAPDFLFYRQSINSIDEMNNYSNFLKENYLGDHSFSLDTYWNLQQMFTDILYKNSVKKVIDLYKEFVKSPIYAYVYDNPPETGLGQWLSKRTDFHFGTVHCDDLFLMFGLQPLNTLTTNQKIISHNFIKMLEDFAQSSDGVPSYANCTFKDNINQNQIQLLSIKQNGCENFQMDVLP